MAVLVERIQIAAPIERVFDITRSIDVHEHTSTLISGRAVAGRQRGFSELGDETTWLARFYGLWFRVSTKVVAMQAPAFFKEAKVAGIPKCFGHEYHFAPEGEGTVLVDEFTLELPFAAFGRAAVKVFLLKKLREVQRQRLKAIQQICESDQWRQYL